MFEHTCILNFYDTINSCGQVLVLMTFLITYKWIKLNVNSVVALFVLSSPENDQLFSQESLHIVWQFMAISTWEIYAKNFCKNKAVVTLKRREAKLICARASAELQSRIIVSSLTQNSGLCSTMVYLEGERDIFNQYRMPFCMCKLLLLYAYAVR